MLHGYLAKGLSVNLGVQVGLRLSGTGKATVSQFKVDKDGKVEFLRDENGEVIMDKKYEHDLKKSTKETDVSIPMGISYEYDNVILDARYNYGLTKDINSIGGKFQQRVFMFTVGYRFAL